MVLSQVKLQEIKNGAAIGLAVLRLEHAFESGHKSNQINANELLETMLSVADELDAQLRRPAYPSVKRLPISSVSSTTHLSERH